MLIAKWIVDAFFLWKAAGIYATYSCNILKIKERAKKFWWVLHIVLSVLLFITSIARDLSVPLPNMLDVIFSIDSSSGFIIKFFKDDHEWFNSLRKSLLFVILIKEYMLGFSVLLVIDLFGRSNEDDDDHECIEYGQYEEPPKRRVNLDYSQELLTETSIVNNLMKLTEVSLPNSNQEGLTVNQDDSFNYEEGENS
jgi:hypothetical protein